MKPTKYLIAVAAACALMATGASAASASARFQASTYPNDMTATQIGEHVFTVDGNTAKCKKAEFSSPSMSGPSSTLTVFAHYTECIVANLPGTVSMNSCDFVYTTPSGSADVYSGGLEIKCGDTPMLFRASNAFGTCEFTIGSQHFATGNKYTNTTGSPGKVEIETKITGVIHGYVDKDTGICPLAGAGTRTDISYSGRSIASATGGASFFVGP